MSLLVSLHLILHITAGIATLIAGPIAIFYNFKQVRHHRIAGKVFFYAMLYVCASAVAGYFRRPDLIFYQFLLGIAIIVLAGIFRGVRAIRLMKGDTVRPVDWAYTVGLGLFGCWMLGRTIAHFLTGGDEPIVPILFGVFGVAALSDVRRNIRMFRKAATVHRLDWYRLHVNSMLGAFTASTTAFMVNVASASLPWYIVWFGPTIALLPLQIYFGRKVAPK
jgi:FtsH-binding integral membrane protein